MPRATPVPALEPLTAENICGECNGTGLVAGDVPKYRKTCPGCHGFRRKTHERCDMCLRYGTEALSL